MTITPSLFEAFLKCPSKCWLRATGETPSGNPYAEWVQSQNESYRATQTERLLAECPPDATATSPPPERLKASQWLLAVDVMAQTPELPRSSRREEAPSSVPQSSPLTSQPAAQSLVLPAPTAQPTVPQPACIAESRLHAVERVPAEGRGKAAQFTPIRFLYRNKLTTEDKLLLAFDAFVLAQALGREIPIGKLIHGDDHATLKVKTGAVAGEVRKRLQKAAMLLSSPTPPDLVLNRHCGECEFQARCRKIAIEKDDLSLLGGMSAKERQKLRSKGIFTVTQLSYTFRPRRRPKRQRDKREKYHHALKALAIRVKRIHIVGSPELKIEGTPVYLDVEGLPDRDFYYLIGLRIGNGDSAVQHSLWADTVEDEGKIWREFLAILETVEKPVLIHYGSYETEFLRNMSRRNESPGTGLPALKIGFAVNLVAIIFAQFYFPSYSNGLKELGAWLKCTWAGKPASGVETIAHRNEWERCQSAEIRRTLTDYNTCDCLALEALTMELQLLSRGRESAPDSNGSGPIHTDAMQSDLPLRFGKLNCALPEFEVINKASYWDYQRARLRLRTSPRLKQRQSIVTRTTKVNQVSKTIISCLSTYICPSCKRAKIRRCGQARKIVLDIHYSSTGLRRTLVKYLHHKYKCRDCGRLFTDQPEHWPKHSIGTGLMAFVCYQLIQQRLSRQVIADGLLALFGISRGSELVERLKERAAEFYRETYRKLTDILMKSCVIHADETHANVRGKRSFLWVFCNTEQAIFMHTDTREGHFLVDLFKGFTGVLVTDFYAAYNSIPCRQQKCLIHLMRDMNNDLLRHAFDDGLAQLAREFAKLLKAIVDTIDRFGLKARFLHKHKQAVSSFFRNIEGRTSGSDVVETYRTRILKVQSELFTFLDHDGVPWNNNSAEHAVKVFAMLRKEIGGGATKRGMNDYVVLLSVYETCKRQGVSFLEFLRSGEKDIHAFAESRRRRRHRSPTREPKALPAAAQAKP